MTPFVRGAVYGEWVALREGDRYPFPNAEGRFDRRWQCECSCGRILLVRMANLITGRSLSCGHGRTVELNRRKKKFNTDSAKSQVALQS